MAKYGALLDLFEGLSEKELAEHLAEQRQYRKVFNEAVDAIPARDFENLGDALDAGFANRDLRIELQSLDDNLYNRRPIASRSLDTYLSHATRPNDIWQPKIPLSAQDPRMVTLYQSLDEARRRSNTDRTFGSGKLKVFLSPEELDKNARILEDINNITPAEQLAMKF